MLSNNNILLFDHRVIVKNIINNVNAFYNMKSSNFLLSNLPYLILINGVFDGLQKQRTIMLIHKILFKEHGQLGLGDNIHRSIFTQIPYLKSLDIVVGGYCTIIRGAFI